MQRSGRRRRSRFDAFRDSIMTYIGRQGGGDVPDPVYLDGREKRVPNRVPN
jgi:hypothetical protein